MDTDGNRFPEAAHDGRDPASPEAAMLADLWTRLARERETLREAVSNLRGEVGQVRERSSDGSGTAPEQAVQAALATALQTAAEADRIAIILQLSMHLSQPDRDPPDRLDS